MPLMASNASARVDIKFILLAFRMVSELADVLAVQHIRLHEACMLNEPLTQAYAARQAFL